MYCSKRKLFGCLSLSVLLSIGFCAELGAVKKKHGAGHQPKTEKPGGITKERKQQQQTLQFTVLDNKTKCLILQNFAKKIENKWYYRKKRLGRVLENVFGEYLKEVLAVVPTASHALPFINLPYWTMMKKMPQAELKDCIRGAYTDFGGNPEELFTRENKEQPEIEVPSLTPLIELPENKKQPENVNNGNEHQVDGNLNALILNAQMLEEPRHPEYKSSSPKLKLGNPMLETFAQQFYDETNKMFGFGPIQPDENKNN
jgi:hypothetical protein